MRHGTRSGYVDYGCRCSDCAAAANTADANAWARATGSTSAERETVGWSDCGHDTWRQGVVLDPFAGSGTTLRIATGHGRDAIGIDLDARNADLARQRVGMWLEVIDHHADEAVG